MSKSQNEILEEQKKARQEFLELKKMQHGEMEPPPKPSEVAIVPKTTAEKAKNIWYHYGKLIIGGLLAAVVIAVMVVQCATRVKPDIQIVYFSYNVTLSDTTQQMAEYFEKYCDDINGDGKVKVQIVDCSVNKNGDSQLQSANITKLQAIIAAEANTMLFITDKNSVEYFSNMNVSGGFFESEPIKLGTDFYDFININEVSTIPEGLTIGCRRVKGTTLEKQKDVETYYKQAQKILKEIS